MNRRGPVCDKDCFNCKFEDCIYDELDAVDYAESSRLDKELTQTAKQKKLAAQQRAYYEANCEKLAAQKRAYYEAKKKKRTGGKIV